MQRISHNDKTIKYVKDPRDVVKYLPDTMIKDISINGKVRVFDYGSKGLYTVEITDKQVGIKSGDICQICMAGELSDYGGCATCNNCGSQLKCGL